jgi:hypothetical protein
LDEVGSRCLEEILLFNRLSIVTVIIGVLCHASVAWAAQGGIWSRYGAMLWQSDRGFVAYSPDRQARIEYTKQRFAYKRGANTVILKRIVSEPQLTEVIWSPSGKRFVINASDGGAVGTWDSFLYTVADDRLSVPINLRDALKSNRTTTSECSDPEYYNIATLGWMSDSQILSIRQVPPHSSCRKMGEEQGFVLEMRGLKASKTMLSSASYAILKRRYAMK